MKSPCDRPWRAVLRRMVLLLVWMPIHGSAAPGAVNAPPSEAAFVFPLKPSPNGRFLVDQRHKPFLVVGDTGWSLIVQPDEAGIQRYLDDRQRRGLNSTIVNLLEHKFCAHPPRTRAGLEPFSQPGDFSTPNPAYFDFAHRVMEQANQRGIVVWLAPAYLGAGGGDEGFFREIKAGGREKLRAYGRFLGQRFKDLPNIVWLMGGDYTPPAADLWTINDLAEAIHAEAPDQPMTVHLAPETSVPGLLGQQPWLTIDTVYSYKPELFEPLQAEYRAKPARPFVLIETTYEGEHHATQDQIRRQAYWALLAGACGQFFGNNPIWHYDGPGLFPVKSTWLQALDSQGSRDMSQLAALFGKLPWQNLEPESGHRVVTEGYGTGLATCLTAKTSDGALALTYVPAVGPTARRELTVDTGALAGSVLAKWFNPTSGQFSAAEGSPLTKGTVNRLRTPGDNGSGSSDWVLVLELW